MNIKEAQGIIDRLIYWARLNIRYLFGKQICKTFHQYQENKVSHIYVINLDRQVNRWNKMKRELSYILDASRIPLSRSTSHISAVDAREFDKTTEADDVINIYSLGQQLFVDPRRLLPPKLDLDEEIKMSRQEVAVALSHIKVWKEIVASDNEYSLVLEDDVYFEHSFGNDLDRIWNQLFKSHKNLTPFEILFLSFHEVELGADKVQISENIFKLFRGIWYLSGYVLSKEGAKKLLNLLPIQGPVDLWINHKFNKINAFLPSKSIITQRLDERSENSYSILPTLSKIGILNSEGPGLFHSQPLINPIFAISMPDSESTSLAMALSMLGYSCCSDLNLFPNLEKEKLLNKDKCIFNAYVNIEQLEQYLEVLADLYPTGKLILLINDNFNITDSLEQILVEKKVYQSRKVAATLGLKWSGRILVLPSSSVVKWKLLCEFLRVSPPVAEYPTLVEHGQRHLNLLGNKDTQKLKLNEKWLKSDISPWVINLDDEWKGIEINDSKNNLQLVDDKQSYVIDTFKDFDESLWFLRTDTFQGNLALFRESNFFINDVNLAKIILRHEDMGVRQYSSGAVTTNKEFLFGYFEVVIKPPKIAGVVTGIFLHRDSPRQEIDIEFLGNNPTKLLLNVYYNPGSEGSRFDYGYWGTPVLIELDFDATEEFHIYAIKWQENKIQWFVDGKIIHSRVSWAPTPIPNLPMKFHMNLWPSQSQELAGKLNNKLLPVTVSCKSIQLPKSL